MEFERHLETLEGETRKRDFSDLKTLFLNCTLKRSPELSHTEGLVSISRTIMEKNGVSVEELRHGWARGVCHPCLDGSFGKNGSMTAQSALVTSSLIMYLS